jgi:Spy/CpxP family protein refolding chaperone
MKLDWRQVFIGVAIGLVLAAASHHLMWRRHHNPDKRFERFAAKLELTSDQKIKMKALFEEGKAKMDALREEGRGKINALLTPEQREKFAKIEERRKKRGRH